VCRKMMWAVLVVGVAMIIAPFAMGLPDKGDGGQKMIDAFAPIMAEENVHQENIDRFNGYIAGFEALGADVEAMVPALAEATGMTPEQVQGFMGEQFPAMTQMMQALPQMQEDFTGLMGLMGANVTVFAEVPGGLEHYEPLVTTMEEQRVNYDKVASLPNFSMFTWFFVIPGVLLVAFSLIGLFVGRKDEET